MNLWDYLDKREERRISKRRALIDKGLDFRSLLRDTVMGADPRFIVGFLLIGLFGWAFAREVDKDTRNLMVGALLAGFAGAWQYYLGSSSSAKEAGARSDRSLDLAASAVDALPKPPAPEPDVILEPGDTAQAQEED